MPNKETIVSAVADPATLLTGERTVPGLAQENYWFRRHEVAYDWLADRVAGRTVLDVGCGLGYGLAQLARTASYVLGLDYDTAAIGYAAATYAGPRRGFAAANLAAVPVRTGAVDVVTALQLIEHVWNHAEFLQECRRVARPGGRLVVTTPNRLTFSPASATPRNPFHTVEFTGAELRSLLIAAGFEVEEAFGVHPVAALRALDERYGGSFVAAQLAVPPARWSAELATDVARITTDAFVLVPAERADLDESLDLVVVART